MPHSVACLTDPQARVNQPLRSRQFGGGHAARARIQQHETSETSSTAVVEAEICITASNAHEKLVPTDGLRDLVGEFGLTLFNPLACCTAPTDAKFVWELQSDDDDDEQENIVTNASSLIASIPRDVSCANLTLDESVASTAVTTPESEEDAAANMLQLEEESSSILQECPRILTTAMMQQLHSTGLPESLQMSRWERCFAIGRDGDSFYSLLEGCAPFQRTIVVIQTTAGHVLGGYAAMPWKKRGQQVSNAYFGTGQSFLFASHPQGETNNNTTTANEGASPLHLYRWTGSNDFCQICDPEEGRLGMGGGCDFGFLVQDCLQRGRTGPCGTFGNPALAPTNTLKFKLWKFTDCDPLGSPFRLVIRLFRCRAFLARLQANNEHAASLFHSTPPVPKGWILDIYR